jgi:simple sugar transport system ATP-binding protein
MDAVLKLSNVSKRYGAVVALNNINFEVAEGEVLGLVGDNGAGKSTLVKTIAGAIHPDEGTIEFDGRIRHWQTPHDSLRAGIETLYQEGGLAPDLSISANVFLGRELYRPGLLGKLGLLDNSKMKSQALAELARVGIATVKQDVQVTNLSGGQRQAVAIGRTVAWARKLILLDEPTNHLSVHASDEVLRIIKQVKKLGIAVILISHTIPHVMEVTDRVISMRLGEIVSDRPTSDLTMDAIVRDITGVSGAS